MRAAFLVQLWTLTHETRHWLYVDVCCAGTLTSQLTGTPSGAWASVLCWCVRLMTSGSPCTTTLKHKQQCQALRCAHLAGWGLPLLLPLAAASLYWQTRLATALPPHS
jgi:hypothetical protein